MINVHSIVFERYSTVEESRESYGTASGKHTAFNFQDTVKCLVRCKVTYTRRSKVAMTYKPSFTLCALGFAGRALAVPPNTRRSFLKYGMLPTEVSVISSIYSAALGCHWIWEPPWQMTASRGAT